MTVALIGALLLLFGSFKVFLWLTERIVSRQTAYENSRVAAGSDASAPWNDPTDQQPLRIFRE